MLLTFAIVKFSPRKWIHESLPKQPGLRFSTIILYLKQFGDPKNCILQFLFDTMDNVL